MNWQDEQKKVATGVTGGQEPAAWMDEYGDVLSASVVDGKGLRNIPLYAHPQPKREWVGLTEEERAHIWANSNPTAFEVWSFALAIETKLKEKNT